MSLQASSEAFGSAHLTDVLRRSGVLGGGSRVTDVVVESTRPTILSTITRLRLTFDGPAPDAPICVIVKTAHPDRLSVSWRGGRNEVAFYEHVAPATLDRYHDALVAGGVTGYDRADLRDDYRLTVLFQLPTVFWQAANGIPPVIWWNNFERVAMAVDDLGCRELLA
jgi:hypothetical protein